MIGKAKGRSSERLISRPKIARWRYQNPSKSRHSGFDTDPLATSVSTKVRPQSARGQPPRNRCAAAPAPDAAGARDTAILSAWRRRRPSRQGRKCGSQSSVDVKGRRWRRLSRLAKQYPIAVMRISRDLNQSVKTSPQKNYGSPHK